LKQFRPARLALVSFNCHERTGNTMQNQFTNDGEEQLDPTTSAAICNAIGERLRRDFGPDDNAMPSRLQMLLDEMQRQDEEAGVGR
jgi:hypothetical protein